MIDLDKIAELARAVPADQAAPTAWEEDRYYSPGEESMLAFIGAMTPAVALDLIGIARAAADSLPKIKEGAALPELPDPLEIDWPELHSQALGCGIEDRNITDRYEAAEYGWQDAIDKAAERVPEMIYDEAQMHEYGAACAAAARLAPAIKAAPADLPKDVEWLQQCAEEALTSPEIATKIRKNCMAAALAGAAPVEAASPWISVEDRLPENMQQVLTCGPLYDEPGRGMWIESAKFAGVFFDFNDDEGEDHYAPTHWMPMIELPAAPAPEAQ